MTISHWDRVVAATDSTRMQHIIENPIMQRVADGELTRENYLSYLRDTYHFISHTSRALALAASRAEDRALRRWLLEEADDEDGHDQFCLKDIRNLGFDPDRERRTPAGRGAWALISQFYYLAGHENPIGILGVASATELMGATMAGDVAKLLVERFGIPDDAVSFLRSHHTFDQRHLTDVTHAINTMPRDEAELELILQARRMTFIHYGQLFLDACEPPVAVAPTHGPGASCAPRATAMV